MLKLTLLLGLLTLTLAPGARAQRISYDIPAQYRSLLTAADYRLVVDSAVVSLGRHYPVKRVAAGTVELQNGGQVPLGNLLARCQATPDRAAWGPLIRQYVGQLVSSADAEAKIDLHRYASMRPYLTVRVYAEEALAQRGGADKVVTRPDLPGTRTVLMLDLPGAFSALPRRVFAEWQQPADSVFRQALANVARQPVQKVSKEFDGPGGNKLTLSFLGNEDYAASYALDLAHTAPEFVGEWGCALAMPNKGLVTSCAISRARPLDFVQYIQLSQPAVTKAYREHAQPISPDFYWYYQGTFTRIPVAVDASGRVNVVAPPALSLLMTAK